MAKAVVFVTNQYCSDRLIYSARIIADETNSELFVVGILNTEYTLDPEVIDYLFRLSKENKATMRLLFSEDTFTAMSDTISMSGVERVITGMPDSNRSVLYKLWKKFPDKLFHTVDVTGELLDVAQNEYCKT